MQEGNSSYYVNSAERPQDRYEDYIVKDLIADVESRFPAAVGRSNRAIIGISMGGFGALNLSLRHPDLFVFASALSPAIDVPSRPFSIKRIGQWREHSSIFGPWGSKRGTTTIPTCWSDPSIPQKLRIFSSHAANKKACSLRTANSPRCSASIIFDMRAIPDREATIGINGIRGCPAFFKACRNTSVARVAESFNRSSKPIPLY